MRDDDRDVITDYFLGAFPKERAGSLLVECYRVLELTPRMKVVFRDIVPSSRTAADPQALAEMRDLYADCGRALLKEFGARTGDGEPPGGAGQVRSRARGGVLRPGQQGLEKCT